VHHALRKLVNTPSTKALRSYLIRSDNTAVCFNINRQAAGPNLRRPLRLLLNLATKHHLFLRARHIPGLANAHADTLSRLSPGGDYRLDPAVLQAALRRLRLSISADLFAARWNRQHRRYFSLLPDRHAAGCDAFAVRWRDFSLPLLHPPIPLLPRVLRRVMQERMRAVLIVPAWEAQTWSPLLRRMTVQGVTLGPAAQVLTPGPRMIRAGAKLPPGNVRLDILDTRTMTENNSSMTTSADTASVRRRSPC
jgi:hypothetical protein